MKLRLLNTCLVLVLALTSSSALRAQDAEVEQAIEGAMQALDEFMLYFNRRDMQAWAGTLNYPHVRFASGNVTVWESAEDFAQGRTFENLPRSGWDHSHWLTRDVVMASAGKVHVQTKFQRYNSANEIIGTYESLYIVTLKEGHWGTQSRSSLAP